jgi:hypothetical protein
MGTAHGATAPGIYATPLRHSGSRRGGDSFSRRRANRFAFTTLWIGNAGGPEQLFSAYIQNAGATSVRGGGNLVRLGFVVPGVNLLD